MLAAIIASSLVWLPQPGAAVDLLGSDRLTMMEVGQLTFSEPTIRRIKTETLSRRAFEVINDCSGLPAKGEEGATVPDDQRPVPQPESPQAFTSRAPEMLMDGDLSDIINAGSAIWKIIEDNQPVYEVQRAVARALPRNIQCWDELTEWAMPRMDTYEVVYTNLFGMEVTRFEFRLVFTYNGTYYGRGRYLNNITLRDSRLEMGAPGYHFYADVEIPQVVNIGTDEQPVAGAEINLNWRLETVIKKSRFSKTFFIDGLGNLKEY